MGIPHTSHIRELHDIFAGVFDVGERGCFTLTTCDFFQGFSWLAIFETGRDGTTVVLTCLAGKILKTRRDGTVNNENYTVVTTWMRRDGTVGVNFLDGTGRYSTMTFLLHDGTGR